VRSKRIRAIFLHAEKHVTIEEAAAMLGRTRMPLKLIEEALGRDASMVTGQ
jgi:hypothetical protein